MITQEEMRKRIQELGLRIAQDYQEKDLLMIGVLKGAFVFFFRLGAGRSPFRSMLISWSFQVMVKRKKAAGRSRLSRISHKISKGKDVLVVEDIVDSGLTLTFLKKKLMARKPKSLRFCTLLDKPQRRKTEVTIDYVGFTIPNKYVVGYGLDYENKYRNLPYIAVLENVREDA
ncbi:MAG: hypoxanthine phosphoribosyltransferase [Candidatus Manganitrophus sp.]|nr:hypoxanthine phosphoribosyltransferase [Candidatus Manganitrophus sp.]